MRDTGAAIKDASVHSLRRRLLLLVLAAIAFASVLQASTAYRTALQQADTMFDYHLQELARSVHGGVPLAPNSTLGPFDVQVQVWGPDGTQIFRSSGPRLPARAVLGFSDVSVEGTRWRVYSVQTPEQTIQIAQDLDARQARARSLALQAVVPIALLAPLLMLAVWWLIDQSLAPVDRMRRQVAARAADDLSPLPETGLPQEVQPLVQELNLLFGRVREAFEAQQQFVADAAHELRSPLAALKLQAQALRRVQDDEPARDAAVARLNDGIERAIALVNQLLSLAREQSGGAAGGDERQWARVDLQDLARQVVADILPQAQARRIDVGLVTQQAAWVHGQAEALHILLRNLLDNAVKYTPEGGQVDIAVQQEAGGTAGAGGSVLSVEDSGPGIAQAERGRVFDRFYRAAGTTQTQGVAGSGLGLAIVRAIAQRHGAQVELGRSQRLGGLAASVRFPAQAIKPQA